MHRDVVHFAEIVVHFAGIVAFADVWTKESFLLGGQMGGLS